MGLSYSHAEDRGTEVKIYLWMDLLEGRSFVGLVDDRHIPARLALGMMAVVSAVLAVSFRRRDWL